MSTEPSKRAELNKYIKEVKEANKLKDLYPLIESTGNNILKVFNNEFTTEGGEDLNTLQTIKDAYNTKLTNLNKDLGKESKDFSLTNNESLIRELQDNLNYKFKSNKTNISVFSRQIDNINKNLATLGNIIEIFLSLPQEKSSEEQNLDNLLEQLYNTGDSDQINDNIQKLMDSTYISSNFSDSNQQEISKKIFIFWGLVEKYLSNNRGKTKLSFRKARDLNKKLEQCITIARKLKIIHNINSQLEYINGGIEELQKLKNIEGEGKDRGTLYLTETAENNVTIPQTTSEDETNWNPIVYSINPQNLILIDANGDSLGTTVKIGTSPDIYEIQDDSGGNNAHDISVVINGKDIKIGTIKKENGTVKISFLEGKKIQKIAKEKTVTLPDYPRYFNIPLKGSISIQGNCTVSHTRHYTGELNDKAPNEDIKDLINKSKELYAVLAEKEPYTKTKAEQAAGEEVEKANNEIGKKEREERLESKGGSTIRKILNFLKKVGRRRVFNLTRGQTRKKAENQWKQDHQNDKIFSNENQDLATRIMHELEITSQKKEKIIKDDPILNGICRKYLTSTEGSKEEEFIKNFTERMQQHGYETTHKYASNLIQQLEKKVAFKNLINDLVSLANDNKKDNKKDEIKEKISQYIMDKKDEIPELYQQFKDWESGKIKFEDFKNYIKNEKACLEVLNNNYKISLKIVQAQAANHISDESKENRVYKLGNWVNSSAIKKFFFERTGLTQRLSIFADDTDTHTQSEYHYVEHFDELEDEAKEYETYIKDYKSGKYKEKGERLKSCKNRLKYRSAKIRLEKHKQTVALLENGDKLKEDIDNALQNYLKNPSDPNYWGKLRNSLLQGYVRLKLHQEKGHNFLYSSKHNIEETTAELLSFLKIGLKTLYPESSTEEDFIKEFNRYNPTYEQQYKKLEGEYKKSEEQFKKQRRNHSFRYGLLCGVPRLIGLPLVLKTIGGWLNVSGSDIIDTSDILPGQNTIDLGYNVSNSSEENHIIKTITNTFQDQNLSHGSMDIKIGACTDSIPGQAVQVNDSLVTQTFKDVKTNIEQLTGLSKSQQQSFISFLGKIEVHEGENITNPELWKMRMYKNIEQIAKGLSENHISKYDSLTINISHDENLDITEGSGTILPQDHIAQTNITRTKTDIPENTPNQPGVFEKMITLIKKILAWGTQIAPLSKTPGPKKITIPTPPATEPSESS